MSNRVLLESIVAKIGNGIDAEQIDQPSDGMLPISRIETIWDGVIDFERVKYAQITKAEIDKYALQSGDILFSHINSPTHIGKTAIYRSDQPLIHGINLLLIRVDQKKCYPEYLNYYFKSKNVRALFRARCKKAVNQASLNQPDILELEVPLPPLTEQKRIASLLARADRLRQLRRTAHDLGDALLQSVFLEMFGDALTGNNPKIPLVPLETLCTKITDGTHVTPTYLNDGVPFLSVKNITKVLGTLDFSDIKYISPEEHKKISKLSNVERGDILYTKVGATYGYAQIVDTDREFSIFVSVALLKPNKSKILPKFFEVVMNSVFVKEQADRLVSGIGVPDLHLREIKTFQIPLPPLSLQEEFVGVVARVESLRGRMGESTRQVEGLFESLLAESFGTG